MQRRDLRIARFFVVTGLAVLLSAPAHAQRQVVAGKELVGWSQQASQSGSGAFSGFVLGVHDAFNEIMFCTSRDVDRQMIEDAVSGFLDTHPELLTKSAADLVRQALASDFPCQQ